MSRGQSHHDTATILWEIALNYHSLVDTLGAYGPGDGDGSGFMNHKLWTPTVREFERLAKLSRTPPMQHEVYRWRVHFQEYGEPVLTLGWHLLEYAIKAEPRIKEVPKTHRKNGKTRQLLDANGKPQMRRVRDTRRHPAASEKFAKACCGWMAQEWPRKIEAELPGAFLEEIEDALLVA